MLKSLPLHVFIVALFFFAFPPLKSILESSLFRPDLSGSWKTATFFSALFWQIFGFINTTCGLLWFSLAALGLRGVLKKEHPYSAVFWVSLILLTLAGLAWLKPLTGHDFISTGYRYQLPLLVFLSLVSAKGYSSFTSLLQKKFFFLLFSLILAEGFLRHAPLLKDYLLQIHLPLPQNRLNPVQWDGSVTLFNGADHVISGGALSRISLTPSVQTRFADQIYKKLSHRTF